MKWVTFVSLLIAASACDRAPTAATPLAQSVPLAAPPIASPAPLAAACSLDTALVPGVPGSPGHYLPSPINPNGQSELAALMRAMQEDMATARANIAAGKPLGPRPEHQSKLRCAWPSTMSDRNPTFDAFAVGYLDRVDALYAAGPNPPGQAELVERYEAVVGACLACHAQTCTGPVVAIEKLHYEARP